MGPDSYYDTLGVSKGADDKEIKKAYRNLARKYHPDVCKEEGAEERFKNINEAYSVLSDPQKRAQYDQMGHAAYSNASKGSYGGGGYSGGFSADFSGFGDIFDTFFGGGFGGRQRSGPRPGADLLMKMQVTLKEAAFGTEKEVSLDHIEPCPACDGSGSETKKFTTCTTCGGSGQMRQVNQSIFGSFVRMTTCTTCGGRGKIPESRCKTCGGSGHQRARQTVKVKVPPGVDTGMRLRMEGYGDAGSTVRRAGISSSRSPSHRTGRSPAGDDLETAIEITPAQATLGSEVEVKTIDERTVILDIPAGVIRTGLKIPGEGVRWQTRPGDMLVRVRIVVPDRLTDEERDSTSACSILKEETLYEGARKGKGFFQDVVDKVKESVK